MIRILFTAILLVSTAADVSGMTITKSALAPDSPGLLLAFDSNGTTGQDYFTMARGGGSSGVGGGESAYGQTFKFDSLVLLDKITIKVLITQDVSGVPLLLWFGKGYTGTTDSGISSLIIEPVADLPGTMSNINDVWYLTLDIEDQWLVPNQTYAIMPRFASGGGDGDHPEMKIGFVGQYAYADGAAFTFAIPFGYGTVLNNEMVLFLHGESFPGDLTGDGFVGLEDLDVILSNWNTNVIPGDLVSGDPSGDGFVGLNDLDYVLNDWNKGVPPEVIHIPEPTVIALICTSFFMTTLRR